MRARAKSMRSIASKTTSSVASRSCSRNVSTAASAYRFVRSIASTTRASKASSRAAAATCASRSCRRGPAPARRLLGPALFVWRGHPADRAQMLELPLPVDLHVVLFITRREPYCVVALTHRERPEEIPLPLRTVAIHFDDRVHHVMLRKTNPIAKAFEKFANRRVPLVRADVGPFPDAVVGEQRDDVVGVVIVVAYRAVTRLEFLDRLDVFENRDALGEFGEIHGDNLRGRCCQL